MLDLMNVEEHIPSTNLKGYSVMIYGEKKVGKTYNASQFPKPLLLAFEKGYSALFGVKPVPINKWTEAKEVLRQLSKDKVKGQYETIIVDTADIAVEYVKEYICNREQVGKIGDIGYGQGYGMYEEEFDKFIREIPKMGYGLVIISHDKDKIFTDESGHEYNKITTTLDKRAHKVVTRAVDIYAYARMVTNSEGAESRKLFLRGTERFEAGSRFKNIKPFVDFSHDSLAEAVKEAVLSEAEEKGIKVSDEVKNLRKETAKEYGTFQEEKSRFDDLTGAFMKEGMKLLGNLEDPDEVVQGKRALSDKIITLVEEELGKGRKVSEMSKSQVDILFLINNRIENELK